MIGGKIVSGVSEEVNDAGVMLDWWNEDVMGGRYGDFRVDGFIGDGSVAADAYDTESHGRVRLVVSLADFARIDGVLLVSTGGDGNYRVSVAETEDGR